MTRETLGRKLTSRVGLGLKLQLSCRALVEVLVETGRIYHCNSIISFFPPLEERAKYVQGWQDVSFSHCKQNFHCGHVSQPGCWRVLGNSACRIFIYRVSGIKQNLPLAGEITTLGKILL